MQTTIDTPAIIAVARRFLQSGDYVRARDAFQQIVTAEPQSVAALNGLAECAFALGDIDAADKYALQALRLSPNDVETLNNAGVILYHRGEFAKAEQALTRAITHGPSKTDSYRNLLSIYGRIAPREKLSTARTKRLLDAVTYLTSQPVSEDRRELLEENHRLRDDVLSQFANRFATDHHRILLHRPANGALKYLMDSWAEVLNHMGIPTSVLSWGASTREVFTSFRPTVFITVADPSYTDQVDNDLVAKYRDERRLTVGRIGISHRIDPTDFVITFHIEPQNDPRFADIDKPLLSLPFGINPRRHCMRPGQEVWDYFFVGSNSHLKTDTTSKYLMPIIEQYSGLLAGTGWQTGAGELTVNQAALCYNFAGVYPNFHLPWQYDTIDEINERSYIIPACGGFELVDNPAAMARQFNSDEMAVAKSVDEYHDMFAHYLAHPAERLTFVQNGMQRVYREYTLFHVLNKLATHLGVERHENRQSRAHTEVVQSDSTHPSVSAVLITYNRSHLLKRTLEALVHQDYPNLEIVVVDDCSTDDTSKVIKSFASRLPHLVHRRNEQNMGAITNRRIAASLATGEYIMMCADDDLLPPGAVREFVKPLANRKHDLVYSDLQVIDQNDDLGTVWRYRQYDDKWDVLRHLMEKGANVIPEAHLVKRDVFLKYWAEWYQKRCVGPTWLAALDRLQLHHIPKPLYQYRIHSNSTFTDATGLLSRNKGVTNFLNVIMFRHSPVELFNTGRGRPLRLAIGESILNFVRQLLVHGGRFVEGTFYTGHRYTRGDQLYAMYYEDAWHWLELAKRYLTDHLTINRLQSNIVAEVGRGYDPIQVNELPKVYAGLPWFAYRSPHNMCEFVPFDMLTVGSHSLFDDDRFQLLKNGKVDIYVQNRRVKTAADAAELLDTQVCQVVNICNAGQLKPMIRLLEERSLYFTHVVNLTHETAYHSDAIVNVLQAADTPIASVVDYLELLRGFAGLSPWDPLVSRSEPILAGTA